MLAQQILMKAILDMKGITGRETSVWDFAGNCLISTNEINEVAKTDIANYISDEIEMLQSCKRNNLLIYIVSHDEQPCYLLVQEVEQGWEEDSQSEMLSMLCVSQLENLLIVSKPKYTKKTFIKAVLNKTISVEEMATKAKQVDVENHANRAIFVIEPKNEEDFEVVQMMKSMYLIGTKDFIVEVSGSHIVFIKELEQSDSEKEMKSIAETLVDTVSAEAMIYVRVGYGNIAADLEHISKAYAEALVALSVGKSFYSEKRILAYTALGVGRLIHQLPITLCREFLHEVLCGRAIEQFSEETMTAANYFFDNNLNISETARQLYVHRNTLVYRLEKIQQKTGLDIRVFEDAMTFKLALMVSKNLNFLESMNH